MIRTNLVARRTATLIAILLAALSIVPLVSVVVTAGWQAWRLSAHDSDRTSTALIAMVEAQNPPEGVTMHSMASLTLPECDTRVDQMPDWTEGEDRFWAS
jgi:hypothetical protein